MRSNGGAEMLVGSRITDYNGTPRRQWGLNTSQGSARDIRGLQTRATVLDCMELLNPGDLVKNAGAISWSEVDSREAALLERCAAGDDSACGELVAAHQRMVYNLALHLLGDRDEALDLSQEVFLRVFRTLSRFRGHSAVRTWIYRIVINQARNRQRWWRRRHRSDQISLDEHIRTCGDLECTGQESPHRLLASKETAARLWVALERLPFDQRTALILREI